MGVVVAGLSIEGDAFQSQQTSCLVQTLGKSIPGTHHALWGKREGQSGSRQEIKTLRLGRRDGQVVTRRLAHQ